ncbi:MAG: AraC family transcriptional regulator [Saprospiraceae bacterium]|nr:AraC family transcriptional regulator [Saprospiraceae bacterium]
MNFYQKKLKVVWKRLYSNQQQVDTAISIRNYIETNSDTDLKLDYLSKTQLVSKFHLIRLFKKYYGLTPHQYLIDVRIENAKSLLAGGKTVTETCFEVGFESLGSFSTLFKRKTGKTPVQFQKSNFREVQIQ